MKPEQSTIKNRPSGDNISGPKSGPKSDLNSGPKSGLKCDPGSGRVLLLVPTTTYRIGDFLEAAQRLGIEVAVGSNHQHVLQEFSDGRTIDMDFDDIDHGISQIIEYAGKYPLKAIVGIDEETTLLAAAAARAMGLRGNDPDAVKATRNKLLFRTRLANSGLPAPQFSTIDINEDPAVAALQFSLPVVLKPLALSASRGVIRADTQDEFASAITRIGAIIKNSGIAPECTQHILVEKYIPGEEVALEGILEDGELTVLALFDKPDPLVGPFFEETIYVTPSCLPEFQKSAIYSTVRDAVSHLGLSQGPIHAELRINNDGVWLIELASRSIGGQCARALQFGGQVKLEDVILRQAIGLGAFDENNSAATERQYPASGVMMIPIPTAGKLCQVKGLDAARASEGISAVTINIAIGETLVPVPEGNRYLGFIFAKGTTPQAVEANLRRAHDLLEFIIEP